MKMKTTHQCAGGTTKAEPTAAGMASAARPHRVHGTGTLLTLGTQKLGSVLTSRTKSEHLHSYQTRET